MKLWEVADWTANCKFRPPQEPEGATFLTLQFVEALRAAAEMEAKYGSKERVEEYRAIIRRAPEVINRESWDAEHGLYADTPTKTPEASSRTYLPSC